MRTTLITPTLLALVTALGCGGGDTPSGEALPEAASYMLRIDTLTLDTETPGWEPYEDVPDDWQIGAEVRIDLEVDGDEIVGYVASEWGPVHEYRGTAGGTTVALESTSGSWGATLNGSAGFANGSLRLSKIVLDAWVEDGRVVVTGAASFEGSADFFAGDVGWTYTAEGDMTGRVDDVAPRARFTRISPLGATRPWEPVRLLFSEPLRRDEILGRVHASGATVSTVFGDDTTRVTSVDVYPTEWWAPEATLETWIQEGYEDAVGNAGAEARGDMVRLAEVEPRDGFDFETAAASAVTSWGDEAFDPPEWIECADGSAGCLRLRRAEMGTVGVYARLESATPFTRIRAQVRVIGEPSDFGGWETRESLVMAAAAEGSTEEARFEQAIVAEDDETLPEPYIRDSGFVTVEVELPEPTTSAGVVLHFADPYGYSDYTRGGGAIEAAGAPIPPSAPSVIVVDDIEAL